MNLVGYGLHGQNIVIKQENEDFSKTLRDKKLTDSLVQYNPRRQTVTVDSRADETYKFFASIHEAICVGNFKHLAPKVEDPLDRCGMIDLMLLEEIPVEYREKYVKKRIEMFETLISKHLNPKLEESFKHSLKILKSW